MIMVPIDQYCQNVNENPVSSFLPNFQYMEAQNLVRKKQRERGNFLFIKRQSPKDPHGDFTSKLDFANFSSTSLVCMQLTKLKLFCLNYFCVLLDRPKRCCRALNSENWVNRSAMNYRCPRFQICIIKHLIISAFHKNVQKLFASDIQRISSCV